MSLFSIEHLPKKPIARHRPVAVFEVLSPEDTIRRYKQELEDYRFMGIPEIWVIDPEDNSFSRYDGEQLTRTEFFSVVERGIVFDMNEIKQLLD